jgi:protoheme IX farnesyltransferase
MRKIKDISTLFRIGLSCATAFSAFAGFFLYRHATDYEAAATFTGILLLACAASALNQIQEKDTDARMNRTMNRPLPSGRLTTSTALTLALISGSIGFIVLLDMTTPIAALLGVFNLLWYNCMYTPLKRKTGFAILIGAVSGAVPPMIGWSAAGGNLSDPIIVCIAGFMFMWQIPHFLLLLLKYGDEYHTAGIPSLLDSGKTNHVRLITFIWFLGTSSGTTLFPVFGIISSKQSGLLLIVLNCLFILWFYRILFRRDHDNSSWATRTVFMYLASVVLIMIADGLLTKH